MYTHTYTYTYTIKMRPLLGSLLAGRQPRAHGRTHISIDRIVYIIAEG